MQESFSFLLSLPLTSGLRGIGDHDGVRHAQRVHADGEARLARVGVEEEAAAAVCRVE